MRWHFVNTLPLVWDILSIGSILIMHHLTFKADQKVSRDLGAADGDDSPQVHTVSKLGSVCTFDEIFNDGEMTAQRILQMHEHHRSIVMSEQSYPPRVSTHTKTDKSESEQDYQSRRVSSSRMVRGPTSTLLTITGKSTSRYQRTSGGVSAITNEKYVKKQLYKEPWEAKPMTSPLSYAASSDLINSADTSERNSVVTNKDENWVPQF